MMKNKLNHTSGASIMIALLFFLICSFIGSSVLAAASTNAGKYERIREVNQDYLTMASVAKTLKEDIGDNTFTAQYVKTEITTWNFVEEVPATPNAPAQPAYHEPEIQPPTYKINQSTVAAMPPTDTMQLFGLLKPNLDQVFLCYVPLNILEEGKRRVMPLPMEALTIASTAQVIQEEVVEVVIETISIDQNFNMDIRMHLVKDGAKIYPMELFCPAQIKEKKEIVRTTDDTKTPNFEEITTTIFTVEVTWAKEDSSITSGT